MPSQNRDVEGQRCEEQMEINWKMNKPKLGSGVCFPVVSKDQFKSTGRSPLHETDLSHPIPRRIALLSDVVDLLEYQGPLLCPEAE